jgi:ABC-type multidrug transport system ATPase subunit
VEEGYELADRIVFLDKGHLVFMKEKQETDINEILEVFNSLGGTV